MLNKKNIINKDWIEVYTDGACTKNGKKGSRAGIGVFFPDDPKKNYSGTLKGTIQTNNRAELYAIVKALELANSDKNIRIYTDSMYAYNSINKYMKNWLVNGWKLSNGKSVKNRDLFEELYYLMEKRKSMNLLVIIQWVKGHSNCYGNIIADKLATNGINK